MSDEKRSQDEERAGTDAEHAEKVGAEAGADDADDADEGADDTTRATPEAIAKRVAALEEEDALERQAREEERKLAERRAQMKAKKGGKKSGLEVAASKKLSKIGTRAEPKRSVAVAADADPLLAKTAKLSDWAQRNQKTVQMVGAAVTVALLGIAGFMYYDHKHETEASVLLAKAVADEHARVGDPAKDDEGEGEGPTFKTYDERRDAALTKYREVESKFAKTGAAILARLAEGSILLDKEDADGAVRAFEDVKNSALAAADSEVKGRALEGIGFAYELKVRKNPGDAAKYYDDALKSYRELENTVDVRGFKELAMYHQARVLQAKGEKDKAKELLVSLKERLGKPEDNPLGIPLGPSFPFLQEVAMDRLREIDPTAAPKERGMPGGGANMSPAQLRKMLEEAQKKAGAHGGGHP